MKCPEYLHCLPWPLVLASPYIFLPFPSFSFYVFPFGCFFPSIFPLLILKILSYLILTSSVPSSSSLLLLKRQWAQFFLLLTPWKTERDQSPYTLQQEKWEIQHLSPTVEKILFSSEYVEIYFSDTLSAAIWLAYT